MITKINLDENKITRLEIITNKGREFVKLNCKIKTEFQDEGKTLKIFVKGEGK